MAGWYYLESLLEEAGEVEVAEVVDPNMDLEVVGRLLVQFVGDPDPSVADQNVQSGKEHVNMCSEYMKSRYNSSSGTN